MKERIPHILNSLSNFLVPIDAYWLSLDAYSVCVDTYVQTAHFKLSMRVSKEEQLCTFWFKQNCKLFNIYEGKTCLLQLYIFLPFLVQLSSSIRIALP